MVALGEEAASALGIIGDQASGAALTRVLHDRGNESRVGVEPDRFDVDVSRHSELHS